MSRFLSVIAILLTLGFVGCHSGGAQDAGNKTAGKWTEYVSQAGRFRVEVPDTSPANSRTVWTPMKRDIKTVPTPFGPQEVSAYDLHMPDCDYTVVDAEQPASVDAAGKPEKQNPNELLKMVVTQMTATGHLVSMKDIKLKQAPGKEYVLDVPPDVTPGGATLKGHVFFAKGHIYQVAAQMHKGKGRMADADKFLDSFQLLD